MTYLQQFNIVIKYNKGAHNKLANMLSRPLVTILCLLSFMEAQPSCHDDYANKYMKGPYFQWAIEDLECRTTSEFIWQGRFLHKCA